MTCGQRIFARKNSGKTETVKEMKFVVNEIHFEYFFSMNQRTHHYQMNLQGVSKKLYSWKRSANADSLMLLIKYCNSE